MKRQAACRYCPFSSSLRPPLDRLLLARSSTSVLGGAEKIVSNRTAIIGRWATESRSTTETRRLGFEDAIFEPEVTLSRMRKTSPSVENWDSQTGNAVWQIHFYLFFSATLSQVRPVFITVRTTVGSAPATHVGRYRAGMAFLGVRRLPEENGTFYNLSFTSVHHFLFVKFPKESSVCSSVSNSTDENCKWHAQISGHRLLLIS